jgi:hypothetical protein
LNKKEKKGEKKPCYVLAMVIREWIYRYIFGGVIYIFKTKIPSINKSSLYFSKSKYRL